MRVGRRADRAAEIERLYRNRYGVFLRVAVGVVRNEHVAEEAVHEAFVRALRHRRDFAGHGSLEAWLWRIVVNEARRRGEAERQSRALPRSAAPDPSETNGYRESGVLEALVATLPERQRLALFLRYYADLDYEAIAEALAVRPGTVAATLHNARSALRRRLLEVER
jgi:RNA polymerase sigma-70 factor, ECF subfamily